MTNFAIAAGHDATADTAAEILHAGGNAFDAAIAAFMTAFVAEPCMASAGGGAFALTFKATGESLLFDFFCQTPIRRRPADEVDFYPIEVDFGDAVEVFHIGRGSTAVPGSIAGIFAMHQHLASMPMAVLAEPAIQLAKEGVLMNDFQYFDLSLLEDILRSDPIAKDVFFPEGHLPKVGQRLRMPQLADFLDSLLREGPDFFYKGEIAQKIVNDQQRRGGFLTLPDFTKYRVHIRKPLYLSYRNHHLLTNPLPSTGGAILALLLKRSEQITRTAASGSLAQLRQLHPILESVDAMGKNPKVLQAALGQFPSSDTQRPPSKWGSTSHFSIIDKWGNAVSLSTTIGEGSGRFIENTDQQLNNMLGEAALLPNGFHSWPTNQRLASMMAPTILLDSLHRPAVITGTGGASRIPSALFQVIHNLVYQKLPLKQAVDAPRLHVEHQKLNIEYGFEEGSLGTATRQEIVRWEDRSMFFGGAHTICRTGKGYEAAGDPRREGVSRC